MKKTLLVACLVLVLGTSLLFAGGAAEKDEADGKMKVALLLSGRPTTKDGMR